MLLAVLLALCLQSCVCTGVNRGDVNLVSLEAEWEMGAQLAQELARELTLVEDPVAQAYLEEVGERIVAQTELADRPWRFHLVADPAINAFVIPGGHVYVHTGLIAAADNAAELTSVMAHEIGHGIARHSTERMTKLYGINFVAELLLGERPGLVEQIAAQLIGSGAVAKFSRDDEREADALGVRYMYEAGYDPAAMATMFETLLEQRRRRPNVVERFFTSHPLTEERIENVARAAEELPAQPGQTTQDPEFVRVQQRLARYAS